MVDMSSIKLVLNFPLL